MRRALRASVAFASTTAVLAGLHPSGAANLATPSRVIDRTLLCSTALRAGVRQVDIRALGAIRQGPQAHPAAVEVFTPWTPDGYLAGLSEGSVSFNHQRCRSAKARVPLTARGLTGGPMNQFGDDYDCTPPSHVLVRFRTTFRAVASLRLTSWDERNTFRVMRASGRVREGYLAIRTPAGKPILFAGVADTGKARLFTADRCIAE